MDNVTTVMCEIVFDALWRTDNASSTRFQFADFFFFGHENIVELRALNQIHNIYIENEIDCEAQELEIEFD